ncbi:MAG: hypothetical protein ABFD75_12385 [Smithella sp.]
MPPAVAAVAVVVVAAVGYVAGTTAAVVIGLAASIAYGAYAMSRMPDSSTGAAASSGKTEIAGRQQIMRSAMAPHRVVYGKCCISGPLVAPFSYGSDNKYVYLVIALTCHECEEISDVYLGDTLSTDAKYSGLFSVTKYLGTSTQTANAELIANAKDRAGNSAWTSNHRLRGRSYIICKFTYDATAYASGIPNVKAVIKGVNDIYDPRTTTNGWSDNPALCVRDYLVKSYGLGCDSSSDIDEASFIAAANICDETVSVRVGTGSGYTTDGSYYEVGRTGLYLISGVGTVLAGDTVTITITGGTYDVAGVSTTFPVSANSYIVETALTSGYLVLSGSGLIAAVPPVACAISVTSSNTEKRYTLNGSFTLDTKPVDIMKKMLTACAGSLIWSQGKYHLYAGAYNVPVGTIDESDLRGDISILPAPSRSQRFNTVRGTFVSPGQNWQQVDFPLRQDATQYAADGSVEVCQSLELPYTISSAMAQRLANLYLFQNLRGISLTWPGKLTCFKYQPGDVLSVNIDELGWVDKEFRVVNWKLADDGGVDLILKEEDSSVYTWTLADEQEYVPPKRTKVSAYSPLVPDVTGFSASQSGAFVVFSWDEVGINSPIAGYEIRYNTQGDVIWDNGSPVTQVEKGTHLVTLKAAPGSWTFLISAVNALGEYSVNAASYDLTVTNTNGIVYGGTGEVSLGWPGTKTNLVEHWTGALVPQSQGTADDDNWDTFNEFVPNPYATCEYEASEMVLPYDYPFRVHGVITSVSSPIPIGIAAPQLYIKWHLDGDSYNTYTKWSIGTITAKYVTMKFIIDTSVGIPVVTDFAPIADAEPQTESGANVTTSSSGTSITFATNFINTPVIQATAIGSAGLTAVISAQSDTGFTVTVYNSSGTAVDGTINWTANGV